MLRGANATQCPEKVIRGYSYRCDMNPCRAGCDCLSASFNHKTDQPIFMKFRMYVILLQAI
jgi:hypothetical protein